MEQEVRYAGCQNHAGVQKDIEHLRGEIKSEVAACRSELLIEVGHIKEITSRLSEENRLIPKGIREVQERASISDQKGSSAHHRLDNADSRIARLEQSREEILRLAMSIEKLAEAIASHDKALEAQEKRIDAIEKRPGDDAMYYVRLAIGAVVTGGIGVLLGVLFTRGG